ncbi:MAG: GWxTD domain-containing protein [Bacteroidia bacterium]|nr:GWxTD domain-containing protein [Bacteroidia bacterium]
MNSKYLSPVVFALVLLSASTGFAQPKNVLFFMDVCRFQDSRVKDPTAEIYFSVDGSSIVHTKRADGEFHAAVKINWFLQRIEQGDSIGVAGDSFVLDWPVGNFPKDTSSTKLKMHLFHFHYIELPPGDYLLQAIVSDQNVPDTKPSMAFYEFTMEKKNPEVLSYSDIKWVAYRLKDDELRNRQDLFPLVTNDAFINQDSIVFYQEIYNTNQAHTGKMVIRARIMQGENILYAYESTAARVANSINAYMMMIPNIDQLRSNTYHLQIELLNLKNVVFSSYRKKFYVYNSRLEQDFESLSAYNREADLFNEYEEGELDYYLRTLLWISTDQERQFARVLETYEQKKNYLYSFWEKRKRFPDQKVEALWRGHLMALDYVNQTFKSQFNEGWRTDRGRIFLKYGIPNDVERFIMGSQNQVGEIPWEMWRYNQLGAQNNVVFVFYDPDRATGEYPILHSTKYGEVYNPRWKEQIQIWNPNTPMETDYEETFDRQRPDLFIPDN